MTLMGSQEKGFSIFKRNHDHFKGKCYFYFLIQWVLLKSFRWKLEKKRFFFCIFQTLNAFSCDLLVFAINVFKTNIFAFIRTLFLTPTFFLANTSNRFFAHFLCFFSPWLSGFLDYLGLQTALWEILRILCENLWRNKLPKLTTLNTIFQLHSAMVSFPGKSKEI